MYTTFGTFKCLILIQVFDVNNEFVVEDVYYATGVLDSLTQKPTLNVDYNEVVSKLISLQNMAEGTFYASEEVLPFSICRFSFLSAGRIPTWVNFQLSNLLLLLMKP